MMIFSMMNLQSLNITSFSNIQCKLSDRIYHAYLFECTQLKFTQYRHIKLYILFSYIYLIIYIT
jgi:hypothetical protein